MELFDKIKDKVEELIAFYKDAMQDGTLSVSEVWAMSVRGIASIVELTTVFPQYSKDQRREAVLQAAGMFYDKVIAPINIPWVPEFVENTIVDPSLRKMFLGIADGVIRGLQEVLGRSVPDLPDGNSDGPVLGATPSAPDGFVPY